MKRGAQDSRLLAEAFGLSRTLGVHHSWVLCAMECQLHWWCISSDAAGIFVNLHPSAAPHLQCRWVSYLGASAAGVPIALIVQRSGWNAYFLTLLASCAIVIVLLLPTINLKSQEQLSG